MRLATERSVLQEVRGTKCPGSDSSLPVIHINGEYLNHLRFVDDLVLFASNEELQTTMEHLIMEGLKIELKLNLNGMDACARVQ